MTTGWSFIASSPKSLLWLFSLGVVSGLTMSFQFGTNWPGYMNTVGNIAGPLLAYEVLTAFFLEATFLGIMLFGFNKVPGGYTLGPLFWWLLAQAYPPFGYWRSIAGCIHRKALK